MATAYVLSAHPIPSLIFQRSVVFLNTALIQWAFKISQDPKAPIDNLAFTNSASIQPLPFKVNFEPRLKTKQGLEELMEGYGL